MFAALVVTATVCGAASRQMDTTIRLPAPKNAATPVLMLENLEVKAGERMTIEVLGPPDAKTKKQPVLAVSGLVGTGGSTDNAPTEKMDMVIPLNEKAAPLMAGRGEVTLTLRLRYGRHRLKFQRAYFK
jgi:hypothetical protein